jgi:glucosamine--fructose-6-phosphate aminotransferase (isomerizing)
MTHEDKALSTAPNPMRDQIIATPPALKAGFEALERDARLVLPTPLIYRTKRIILVGSGDSYFAAKAAEMALMKHAGLPVEVRTPLEAGRYHSAFSTRRDLENTLVIALSNSGAAARVCEAAALYRRAGAQVLAITKNPTGRLAENADYKLVVAVPGFPSAPGFGPYLFAMVALQLLAMRFGEVRMGMTMDQAQALRGKLLGHFDDLAATIAAADEPARALAEQLSGAKVFEFLGGGPSRAVADYGAAKLLEAAGRHATGIDLEEWTHLNYFDASPQEIATLMVLPPDGRSASRAAELRVYIDKLGRQVGILPIAAEIEEIWTPLLTSAPLALFAAHLAALDGAEYGRGSKGAWSDSSDASTVQKSAMFGDQP